MGRRRCRPRAPCRSAPAARPRPPPGAALPRARHVGPEVAELVGHPRRARRRGQRPPAVGLLLAGQRQVHADVERRVGRGDLGGLGEPRAGHHHRARAAGAELRQLDEGGVGAMAHADVVLVDHHALGHPVPVETWRKSRRPPRPGFLDESLCPNVAPSTGPFRAIGWVQFEPAATRSTSWRSTPGGPLPLHRQLCDQLRELILSGAVPPEARLPSIRDAATGLAVSRNTVVAALDQLAAEGLIESPAGIGDARRAGDRHPARRAPSTGQGPRARPTLSARGALMSGQPRVDHAARTDRLPPRHPRARALPVQDLEPAALRAMPASAARTSSATTTSPAIPTCAR